MTADAEPTLTITTEDTDVASLSEGDLVHVVFPAPHPRVVSNEHRGCLLAPNRRSKLTLVDSAGTEKQFYLSPDRQVKRVTNAAIPVGPWRFVLAGTSFDLSDDLALCQRHDALWYKVLWPIARPLVQVWREILDLQCRAYSLKLRAGFWGMLFIVLAAAIGLATRTAPELSVAIGIVGAFIVERCWDWWRSKARRKLAKGVVMRVRYKPSGPEERRYGTLHLRKQGAIIVGGKPGQVWFSTEMCLRRGKRVLATCAFANDIRGDLTKTTTAIAEAIRHRIDNGSHRVIYATSPKYDPDGDAPPDIMINPSDRSVGLAFPDHENNNGNFSVTLKLHQARTLADALEVMDEGRRL